MDGNTTISITVIIALIGCIITVASFFIGRMSASKTDGKEQGILINKVDNIGSDLQQLSNKMDIRLTDIQDDQKEFRERMASVEQSVKSAHHRIDTIEKKGEK